MRWHEDITLQFVKLYLRQECLWDPNHENYKKKHSVDQACWNIVHEFKSKTGISLANPVEVKRKIKVLRNTYALEITKIKRKLCQGIATKSRIKWFPIFHKHLKSIITNRSGAADISDDEQEDVFDDTSRSLEYSHDNSDNEVKEEILFFKPHDNPLMCTEEEFQGDGLNYNQSESDEFEVYGKYIASQLRRMELRNALNLQKQIQNLVSEARIAELSSRPSN